MDRYRFYAPQDDAPITGGDTFFIGVNQFDAAENLEAGQCQAAINKDFTRSNADTRGGLVCLPALGATPFGSAWVSEATSAEDNNYHAVAYGNGNFVAVSNTGTYKVMTSPDGVTWIPRTAASALLWWSVCFGQGLFVAVANQADASSVMTSSDGVTWTSRTASDASVPWGTVCYGTPGFVALASNGSNKAMFSADGITWSAITPFSTYILKGVTYGGGKYVAVLDDLAAGEKAYYSTDGQVWTLDSSGSSASGWVAVTYGNGQFVAVSAAGPGARVMTSTDGITWTTRTAASNNAWRSVVFGNGQFMAVASTGTGDRVMASIDGIAWQSRTSAADNEWYGVAFGGTLFVAVSITGTLNRAMRYDSEAVYASTQYSDPNVPAEKWMVLAGATSAGFYAFGRTSRSVSYPAGYSISEQATIVQANNYMIIFAGDSQTPIRWDGTWSGAFEAVPAAVSPNVNIPDSNQGTYYVNRLWVVDGKDSVAASDLLDFTNYDPIYQVFNLNIGSSDYVVCTYPFGVESLLVFKNQSIQLLQNVAGSLTDVTATEVTRQVGIVGINAVVSVGPDVVYMSDRNINLISLTETNNSVQHKTLPLSAKIKAIMQRVNWGYAYKVSMAFWDNKLFVALPLDNATSCSTIVVYNFVTEQWWGEWNFNASLNLAVQGFLVSTYGSSLRLHAVTEDGRIFVTEEGQNDISGTTVAEIADSVTTRAYRMNNENRVPRRMWMDIGTNRPDFSVVAYADGASESETILADQTYSRANSWIFSDTAYDATNANDDYNRAGRQDYSSGPASVQSGTGFQPEMLQEYRFPIITRRKGRLAWFKISNNTGRIVVNGAGCEARPGDRGSLVQVI